MRLHFICECTGISFQRGFLHFQNLPLDTECKGLQCQGCRALLGPARDRALSWHCHCPGSCQGSRALQEWPAACRSCFLSLDGRAAVSSPGGCLWLPALSTGASPAAAPALPWVCSGAFQEPRDVRITHLMEVWSPCSQNLGRFGLWSCTRTTFLVEMLNKLGALLRDVARWPWLSWDRLGSHSNLGSQPLSSGEHQFLFGKNPMGTVLCVFDLPLRTEGPQPVQLPKPTSSALISASRHWEFGWVAPVGPWELRAHLKSLLDEVNKSQPLHQHRLGEAAEVCAHRAAVVSAQYARCTYRFTKKRINFNSRSILTVQHANRLLCWSDQCSLADHICHGAIYSVPGVLFNRMLHLILMCHLRNNEAEKIFIFCESCSYWQPFSKKK